MQLALALQISMGLRVVCRIADATHLFEDPSTC